VSHDDADSGIWHIRRLLALAESLCAIRISVYDHEWHDLAMGSWSLTAGTRHRNYLSPGTVAMALCPFRAHFTLVKAALRDHHQSRMSGLVFLLRLIPFIMSSLSFTHTQTPNQSLERTADRRENFRLSSSIFNSAAQLALVSGRSAYSR
jgi:hypothetical protein